MKRPAIAILSAALLLGFPVIGQQDPAAPDDNQRKASSTDATGQMETFEGTVKLYEAGKQLIVTTSDKKMKTFRLDQEGLTLNIDPAVAVGAQVKVTVQKSGDGTKSLTVAPLAKASGG